MYQYDAQFFKYAKTVAERSANAVVPHVYGALQPKSVLDVGCGQGFWVHAWKAGGVREAIGIDGGYVSPESRVVSEHEFVEHDLGGSFSLGRQFDLVQSLEVAEHLQPTRARAFVADLCAHGNVVLFSAAPPGQGGEHHINEQPYEYWRALFIELGYEAFDFIRPQIKDADDVASWYRYNILVYVHKDHIDSLPPQVRQTQLNDAPIEDVAPFWYRCRRAIVRNLPPMAQRGLVNVRKRLVRKHAGS